MTRNDLTQYFKRYRQWFFSIRNEPEALAQFRILILGVIACLVAIYVADSLLLDPLKTQLTDLVRQREELEVSRIDQVIPELTPIILQLQQRKNRVTDEIAMLQTQKDYLQTHRQQLGDPERFNKVIFTMLPSAPLDIEKYLDQMTLAKMRSLDSFKLQPVHLSGMIDFHSFMKYLHYLEQRQEIGIVDELTLKRETANEEKLPDTDRIRFELLVGRAILKTAS